MAQRRIIEISYYDDKENNLTGFVEEVDKLVNKHTGGKRIEQIEDNYESSGSLFYSMDCGWKPVENLIKELETLTEGFNSDIKEIDLTVNFYHYTEGEVVDSKEFTK